MIESPNKRAVIVGIFILVGIVLLVAGVLTIGNLRNTFSTKIHVYALFEDVNGLQKGNNIWFSGVKIGTVKTVRFFGQKKVKVVLNIDEDETEFVRRDAKVKISTDGLIGNKILVIYGGSMLARAVGEGDTLAVDKVFSSEEMINTLQENNKNLLEITKDFKSVSNKVANGKGNIGKLLDDETIYNNISATATSLRKASDHASTLVSSLSVFSAGLNKKGTFANNLVNDTIIFNSLRSSVLKLNKTTDSAAVMINNLKEAGANTKTPVGILLHDEQAGASLKVTLLNLEKGSKKLDEDLEGLQHSFILRKYFRKKK